MSILKILTYPDPVLKQVAEPVEAFNSSLKKLISDMTDTMYEANGIGLAAPQVRVAKRVIVLDLSEERDKPMHLINPEIIWREGSEPSEEGCLSIPGFRDTISRNAKVKVRAQDSLGQIFELQADNLFAFCLQHEIDHLDGILFIDRLSRLKKELFLKWFKKQGPLE